MEGEENQEKQNGTSRENSFKPDARILTVTLCIQAAMLVIVPDLMNVSSTFLTKCFVAIVIALVAFYSVNTKFKNTSKFLLGCFYFFALGVFAEFILCMVVKSLGQ